MQGTEFHISSSKGVQLFARFEEATNPRRGNCLLLHGYAEHSGRYNELAECLRNAGLDILRFDFRGHGKSEGRRGHIDSIEEYLSDIEAANTALLSKSSGPTLLVGHSNGGLLALRLLADPFRCPSNIHAYLLSSPFLQLRSRSRGKQVLARVASTLIPRLSQPNGIASEELTSDPLKIAEHKADPLINSMASARWFVETVKTQEWVSTFVHRVQKPGLWMVSGKDLLANPDHSVAIEDKSGGDSSFERFDDLHHELFNEVGREVLLNRVAAFVDERFKLL